MFGNCVSLATYFVTIKNGIWNIHICHQFVVIRIRISNTHQTSYNHPSVDLRLRLLKTFASWVCSSPHDLAGAMIQHCGQEYLLLWQQPLMFIDLTNVHWNTQTITCDTFASARQIDNSVCDLLSNPICVRSALICATTWFWSTNPICATNR